jgi:heme exporter protein C
MAFCAAAYLVGRQELEWDHWSQAAAEVGWICTTLTLATGSAWAHEAWGVWWTWEPRLTSSLVLWLINAGVVLTRASIEDPHQRARVGGILAIIGAIDLPLVIMATRWFRGIHPVAPEMDSRMRWVLLASITVHTVLFAHLVVRRQRQLAIGEQLDQLDAALRSSWASPRG